MDGSGLHARGSYSKNWQVSLLTNHLTWGFQISRWYTGKQIFYSPSEINFCTLYNFLVTPRYNPHLAASHNLYSVSGDISLNEVFFITAKSFFFFFLFETVRITASVMKTCRCASILMNLKEEYFQSLIAWFMFLHWFLYSEFCVFVRHASVLIRVRCFATSVVSSLSGLQSEHLSRLLPINRLNSLSKTT